MFTRESSNNNNNLPRKQAEIRAKVAVKHSKKRNRTLDKEDQLECLAFDDYLTPEFEERQRENQERISEYIEKRNAKRKQSRLKAHPYATGSLDASLNYAMEQNTPEEQTNLSIRSMLTGQPNPKRQKLESLQPTLFVRLNVKAGGKPKVVILKALLDSGASATIIHQKFTDKLRKKQRKDVTWDTAAGSVKTTTTCKAEFTLPELDPSMIVEWNFYVAEHLASYDMIIGRDLLKDLKIKLDFDTMSVQSKHVTIPMKPRGATYADSLFIAEPESVEATTSRIHKILDAKYEKADLDKVCRECTHLTEEEQAQLLALLKKYELLFDGTLGTWTGDPYDIELKPDAKPYHARAYPIPKVHEDTLRREVQRLCNINVLKKINNSEWAAPTFIIPKKNGTVRFISDFRELNKRIKRKPFPLPKIQDLLLKLEGFQYATSLDLNMGSYHIKLSPFSQQLCTIVLPWGKYSYQALPMGLCNSPDIFQEKITELMEGLEFARTYLDDLLIISKRDFNDHLKCLELVLDRIEAAGLKINADKSHFGIASLEYLGYWITREGIKPVAKKVDAIMAMKPPTNKHELRSFIGVVNYYRDMWIRRSHVLAPLTKLTGKDAKWQWGPDEQHAFELMKKIIGRQTLLAYPDFSKPFVIHTDASQTQLGSVISQDNKPIAFYSRKLNDAQTRYTTTERELLSIVETLKEFRNILLGQAITVYTDHKNLTYKNFNTDRVMRWRLIIEEFGADLQHIPGNTNIVANALSRLGISNEFSSPETTEEQAAIFAMTKKNVLKDRIVEDDFPLSYPTLEAEQRKDKTLQKLALASSTSYSFQMFHGGGKSYKLLCREGKICVPDTLQKKCVDWYHAVLCHPGETRTELTIRQHFYWKNLRDDVVNHCKKCERCQITKRKTIKYGHVPEKEAETEPWDKLCVDLIGPYKVPQPKGKAPITLWCLTMIDPATGWFEIAAIENKTALEVANVAEMTWFCRYPWPTQIVFDRGTEFMGEFTKMAKRDYGLKTRPITARNPQANSMVERVHQTIGNMFRTMQPQHRDLAEENSVEKPWDGILAAIGFAVRTTYHTTTQASPAQLVFGRDPIFNIAFEANWQHIRQRKQKEIARNNKRENSTRKPYQYHVNEKVLVKNDQPTKFGKDPYDGPHTVVAVRANGSIRIAKTLPSGRGNIYKVYNIRQLHPFKD